MSASAAQTLTYVWLVIAGGQAALYAARARGAFWSRPLPGRGLLLASVFDIALATLMASLGWLMTAIPLLYIGGLLLFALVFLVLGDGIKALTFKAMQLVSNKRSSSVREMTAPLS
jgi:H+-transporting ATPase